MVDDDDDDYAMKRPLAWVLMIGLLLAYSCLCFAFCSWPLAVLALLRVALSAALNPTIELSFTHPTTPW
jgi:hypothetical protein